MMNNSQLIGMSLSIDLIKRLNITQLKAMLKKISKETSAESKAAIKLIKRIIADKKGRLH